MQATQPHPNERCTDMATIGILADAFFEARHSHSLAGAESMLNAIRHIVRSRDFLLCTVFDYRPMLSFHL